MESFLTNSLFYSFKNNSFKSNSFLNNKKNCLSSLNYSGFNVKLPELNDLSINFKGGIILNEGYYGKCNKSILTPLLTDFNYKTGKRFSCKKTKYIKKNNIILCENYRLDFWKQLENNNSNTSIYIIKLFNKNDLKNFSKNYKNSNKNINLILISYKLIYDNLTNEIINKFLNINFDILFLDHFIIQNKTNINRIDKFTKNLTYYSKWLNLNKYDGLFEDDVLFENIVRMYFNKKINYKSTICNSTNFYNKSKRIVEIKKITDCGNIIIDNKSNTNLKKNIKTYFLNFNEMEREGYNNYINKFKDIYLQNYILFENDEYLKKYCCFPQDRILINYFNKNNNFRQLNINSNYKKKFQENLSNILNNNNINNNNINNNNINNNNINNNEDDINCLICLNKMDKNNIGITKCGHIFCYTCIIHCNKLNNSCPKCRTKLDTNSIYLYKKDDDDLTFLYNTPIMEKLGTKINKLVLTIINILKKKKRAIVFSNFNDNLIKIKDIIKNLNIDVILIENNQKGKKILEENNDNYKVYLINYDFNFFKITRNIFIDYIIFNEPLYKNNNENNIKNKMLEIHNTISHNKIINLVIKDTIENNIFNRH